MDRRQFIKFSLAATGTALIGGTDMLFARGTHDESVGLPWRGWKEDEFQIHFIYTGVGESMFFIFPDSTTLLLDCGDHNAIGRGKLAVPTLPGAYRHAGEWVARYVSRVNPHAKDVDYMMLSHYHSDHGGCETFHAGVEEWQGKPYYLSGFAQAAKTLTFHHAIDRCYPEPDDPLPLDGGYDDGVVRHMRRFYDRMQQERGMTVEKFRVGDTNQLALLHQPQKYPDFFVRNLCGNGRIAAPDGTIRDLYAERISRSHPKSLNENGMSLGMVIGYGPFRYFTAGDFSDGWKLEDGSRFEVEDAMAEVCGRVDVAKINHHGHYSMTEKLVRSLQAQAYVACVWDQLHCVDPVMARLADRSLYADDRLLCPGIMPVERRTEDAGKPWLDDVHPATYEGAHIVLNVPRGGKQFSITFLSANDEQMTVRSSVRFKTHQG